MAGRNHTLPPTNNPSPVSVRNEEPPRSGLVQTLEKIVLDRSLRRKLRKSGLEHTAKFTWKRYAEGVIGIYRKVLNLPGEESNPVSEKEEVEDRGPLPSGT